MTVQEIAPLIVRVVSPRKLLGGVVVRTVGSVLDFFEVYHHVEGVLQASRGLKISAELDTRCYVQYLP
jgi:hypothetical protein